MRCVIEPLTFALLDDIVLAMQSKSIAMTDLPPVLAGDLGPLIELRHAGVADGDWLSVGRHSALLGSIVNGGKWFHPSDNQGFVTIAAIESEYAHWTDFAMRAKRAATGVGFADDNAGQLVAAIGELRSNIVEHSERKDTGYLVYDVTPGRFDFVVADAGIGVLQSLRSHSHFSSVTDAGTAIKLALTEGVSRHADDKDRGRGFRPIFVGLANVSKHLRFRSADHSHEIVRDSNGALLASTHQRASIAGFLCCVTCEPKTDV
jgi:anti-sigma regulatory factor (Ser/Thr protein kinase)